MDPPTRAVPRRLVRRAGLTVFNPRPRTGGDVDHIVPHHCHIVNIQGNSYRMRQHQHWLRSASEERRDEIAP